MRDEALEGIRPLLPDLLLLQQPAPRSGQGLGAEAALANAALLDRGDAAAALEEADVLEKRRKRHVERLRELADAGGAMAQPCDNRTPRWIGQGQEDAIERG